MRKLVGLLLAIGASVPVYVVTLTFFLEKPFTHGFLAQAYALKVEYAEQVKSNRMFLAAGSNGLYSFSCRTIEAETGVPCVNMALSAEIGLDYELELVGRHARDGDSVVLAFEYETYQEDRDFLTRGNSHPFRLVYDRKSILSLDSKTLAQTLFQFDLRYVISAAFEMTLKAIGVERRTHVGMLNRNGDMTGHNRAAAQPYGEYIRNLKYSAVAGQSFDISAAAASVYGEFVKDMNRRNVKVIATLPVTFDDAGITKDVADRIANFFTKLGAKFIVLPNLHVYARGCFFDTHYHLTEECQIAHSRAFAQLLKDVVARRQ